MGDLTELHEGVKLVFEHFGLEDPAFVISFTCEPNRDQVFYVSNMERADSIKVLKSTAEKMTAKSN